MRFWEIPIFHGMNVGNLLIWFFIFSLLGWAMECVVIRVQMGFWENRGFAKMPFCVIYGFGGLAAVAALDPIKTNYVAIYIIVAIGATCLEYLTAMAMMKIFGAVWWDYSKKKFNYRGVICLESTIGWGILGVSVICFANVYLESWLSTLPALPCLVVGMALVISYLTDFTYHFIRSLKNPDADPGKQRAMLKLEK